MIHLVPLSGIPGVSFPSVVDRRLSVTRSVSIMPSVACLLTVPLGTSTYIATKVRYLTSKIDRHPVCLDPRTKSSGGRTPTHVCEVVPVEVGKEERDVAVWAIVLDLR